jgi:hypothetical protein
MPGDPFAYLWHIRNYSRIIPGAVVPSRDDRSMVVLSRTSTTLQRSPSSSSANQFVVCRGQIFCGLRNKTTFIHNPVRCCWCHTFCWLQNKTTRRAATAASTVAAASGLQPIIKLASSIKRIKKVRFDGSSRCSLFLFLLLLIHLTHGSSHITLLLCYHIVVRSLRSLAHHNHHYG